MAMSAPSMPADLQMVEPDPSLPKELSAFFGKWEAIPYSENFFAIVEKIDEEKISLHVWSPPPESYAPSWTRREANVIKEGEKYKLWFSGRYGNAQLTLKGEYLNFSLPAAMFRLKRVQ